jgi:hypothetical protein
MMTPEKRTKILERHLQRLIGISGICYKCKDEWPCDAIAAVEAFDEAEKQMKDMRQRYLELQAYAERAIRGGDR